MIGAPEVSVVMGVYNGANKLVSTMDSILRETEAPMEVIVVDDGSTDNTADILAAYAAQDSRVRVITQSNTGLTGALINGCRHARAEFIARHDNGDRMLPNRIQRQRDFLRAHPEVVMTSCGTRFVGPGGEFLYEVVRSGAELQEGLMQTSLDKIKGVSSHPSVMFRRRTYEAVGGYRSEFYVAQDLDLWMRMAEVGLCSGTTDILCEVSLESGSISASRRDLQIRTTRTIFHGAVARRQGLSDAEVLREWSEQPLASRTKSWKPKSLIDAQFYYFVAAVLRSRDPQAARAYYARAIRLWPAHARSWLGLVRTFSKGRARMQP